MADDRSAADGTAVPTLTQDEIETGLRRLGLQRGDAVEVHSSLSSMGYVTGGAETVIAALLAVVGEEGAVLMSCYAVTPALPVSEAERARGIAWKVRWLPPDTRERTGMGVVSDTFRWRPDVVCGEGLHRVCAWGHDADRHRRSYEHLLAVDGWALLIGVDIWRCSSMHLAERVPIPASISAHWALPPDLARDYPEDEWGIGYGGTPGDAWGTVWAEAMRRGLIRQRQIGAAQCALFKAKAMVAIYEQMRREDPYGLFGLEAQSDDAEKAAGG